MEKTKRKRRGDFINQFNGRFEEVYVLKRSEKWVSDFEAAKKEYEARVIETGNSKESEKE